MNAARLRKIGDRDTANLLEPAAARTANQELRQTEDAGLDHPSPAACGMLAALAPDALANAAEQIERARQAHRSA